MFGSCNREFVMLSRLIAYPSIDRQCAMTSISDCVFRPFIMYCDGVCILCLLRLLKNKKIPPGIYIDYR